MWIAVKFQSSLEIAGRALNVLGGIALTEDYQTPNAVFFCLGVRLWVIRFIVKRATAQIVS